MPRSARIVAPGYVYHVLNRANGRSTLFAKSGDYRAFEKVLAAALVRHPQIELFCYCLMPNHWHLAVRPTAKGDLAAFMQWLTLTHVRRWQEHRRCHGTGHVYQGRYKSFPVETERYFVTLTRYIERNAARAGLVESDQAQAWRWSSLWLRRHPHLTSDASGEEAAADPYPELAAWPIPGGVPRGWLRTVNTPLSATELESLRRCGKRGRPFGSDDWTAATATKLGLDHTLRPRGRPRKQVGQGR